MSEAIVTNVEKKVRECRHCGNLRELNLRAIYNEKLYYEERDLTEHRTWRLLQCPGCEKPTLEETIFLEGDLFPEDKILYPPARPTPTIPSSTLHSDIPDEIPPEIASEYSAALQVRGTSNACAVLIRRTLEVICQYEKAKGKDLSDKIQDLATSGRIPQKLADMAHLTRQIGNLGAHVDISNDKVTKRDVTTMIDFLDAILEYLYVAPAKIAAVQARLKKTP